MRLQIVTPEYVVFDAEVDVVTVPGKDGEFQIMKDHAPIVATLGEGTIKIKVHSDTFKDFDNASGKVYNSPADQHTYLFDIKGGILEMNNNFISVLAS
ncbi:MULTISPECIES: F0F1 ATP synthase subunit epsilon [Weeksella]|uniref:ATPase, F1 complex, delta/epsilon subunit n=1 Tax=Weeksella virosa (strain ATCC 43766 / DSM 16922 / JCM 21250 / CCUG 30538 / CDC 9751 / IAM 14551 / NBRC 16016 / NCTC 11634 / CL345/78) TaxID=865938 RepID=F0P192_WEEVC|nr:MULTISPECIES: F0F1 ATP synthase subunit epsilon [Weeksella]ADX67591.1 ATPase, F1 complex, delta/epsilon subunit [Weeksella virosa DSM 16922]MDK7375360.1 F0F1 ATP synthase subunit epsilon [Weeksella virosa]MDK7676125.1 F0F1 ATP synthase subunit epsilon [Weeksella virosa]OFM82950.1 ATP synthase subunit delta [Weeksella sp. HMSC059D05]SUP53892.1 F-ATPase epsilon subunit [Weeksella virosa]